MRRVDFICVLIGLAVVPAAASASSESLGVFDRWAALRDPEQRACRAVARPIAHARQGSYIAVATWPARAIRNQIVVRLGKSRLPRSPLWLDIGDARIRLSGSGTDAWALDQRSDRAIVAAMRSAPSMTVRGIASDGSAIYERYPLKGAASAIDAAAIACATGSTFAR